MRPAASLPRMVGDLAGMEQNPYPLKILYFMDELAISCMYNTGYITDKLICCFLSSSNECKNSVSSFLHSFKFFPFLVVFWLMTLPMGFVGFCLWWLISFYRKPYRLSYCPSTYFNTTDKNDYNICTVNLCLGYESHSKYNKLTDPKARTRLIGKNIVAQQIQSKIKELNKPVKWQLLDGIDIGSMNLSTSLSKDSLESGVSYKLRYAGDLPINHDIKTELPALDVICLQEVWDLHHARRLAGYLHEHFPYIIYDVGESGLFKNGYLHNSGLMIASKYPFLNIGYKYFKTKTNIYRFAAIGCLQVKVQLKRFVNGQQQVGYIFTTYLQAYSGLEPVLPKQMSSLLEWANKFKKDTLKDTDNVAFDVMAGDFNSDNMSPVHFDEQHHALFRTYVDVCRIMPGEDQPWTVGTEMCLATLHEQQVQTPYGMKAALEDPFLRQYYFTNADLTVADEKAAYKFPDQDKEGNWILSPVGGRRRVDYILCRIGTPVRIKACNVVTQLAGLTDHVAVTLSIHCYYNTKKAYSEKK